MSMLDLTAAVIQIFMSHVKEMTIYVSVTKSAFSMEIVVVIFIK